VIYRTAKIAEAAAKRVHHSRTRQAIQTRDANPARVAERSRFRFFFCYHSRPKLRSESKILVRISCDEAYPRIEIAPSSRNWWARLKGTPAECIHVRVECVWIATLLPDTLYLRGKRAQRRETVRPEVTLCRDCLLDTIESELADYDGRVVAFEPDAEIFTQYFFVAANDFEAAGLALETASAIEKRLAQTAESCAECSRQATWLWFSREAITSLDEFEKIHDAQGERFCAAHGAQKLASAFEKIAEVNVFYMNLPYGEAGAYVWI
jgi:hypothetical protein